MQFTSLEFKSGLLAAAWQKAVIKKAFLPAQPQNKAKRFKYQGFYWLNKSSQQIPQKFFPQAARITDLFVEILKTMWMC